MQKNLINMKQFYLREIKILANFPELSQADQVRLEKYKKLLKTLVSKEEKYNRQKELVPYRHYALPTLYKKGVVMRI